MYELLKKVGVPATVALVVVALITIVPMIFGVDGRYAKDAELKQLQADIKDLSAQVSQMIGAQQSLITLVAASNARPVTIEPLRPAPAPVIPPSGTSIPSPPIVVSSRPPRLAVAPNEEVQKLEDINKRLATAQKRVDNISNKY